MNIHYDALKLDTLEKINSIKPEEMAVSIIMSLNTLKKEGKYKTSDQLWAEREKFKNKYDVKRIN